ncbi:MAG TPA: DUF4229 domain-containing protein [Microbacteriaceae bacterium]|nr:DUF4229 domain-containing protein [Microbacteriaceae bacterium]
MKRIPAWLWYSILRLSLLAVPFGVLLALGISWLLAIAIATALSLALSLVLLRRPREATSIALAAAQARREARPLSEDDDREDAEIDGQRRETQAD